MIKENMVIDVYGHKTKVNKINYDPDGRLYDLIEVDDKIQATVGSPPTNYFFRWEIDHCFQLNYDLYNAKMSNYEIN
jgi:hypothetical protein